MKSLLLFTILIAGLLSCSEKPKEQDTVVEKFAADIPEEDNFPYDTLQGLYMGDFGGSPIRIILNYVSNKNAIGYDIHKGLQRNIMGKVTKNGDSIQLILSEPGDNKFDGVFTLNFTGIDQKPTGEWTANNKKIPGQKFKLKKIVEEKNSDDKKVTIHNFANIFGQMSDTIGDYSFENDGLVILKYYDRRDDDQWDKSQYKEIKGSWELNGDRVVINWEPNPIYKSNRLELKIQKFEYGEYVLRENDKHELYMMWY